VVRVAEIDPIPAWLKMKSDGSIPSPPALLPEPNGFVTGISLSYRCKDARRASDLPSDLRDLS
ncbi:MAG: hypothetical protein CBC55_10865, partial [Gammaproteobacteria bacterium TMED95]